MKLPTSFPLHSDKGHQTATRLDIVHFARSDNREYSEFILEKPQQAAHILNYGAKEALAVDGRTLAKIFQTHQRFTYWFRISENSGNTKRDLRCWVKFSKYNRNSSWNLFLVFAAAASPPLFLPPLRRFLWWAREARKKVRKKASQSNLFRR